MSAAAKVLIRVLRLALDASDLRAHVVGRAELDGPLGRGPARPIVVERQHELVRVPLEHADLVLGQGGARAGHGVGHPELVADDDVELAFHHHGVAALPDRLPSQVEAEEHPRLVVGGGLRGVHVLTTLLVLAEDRPSGERHHLPALVPDRYHQAALEEVPPPAHQPGHLGVGERSISLGQERDQVGAPRRVPEREVPCRLGVHLPTREQLPAGLAGRGVVQHVLVVLRGESVEFHDSAAGLGALAVGRRAVGELDPGLVGEDLEGTPEVDLLDLFNEAEQVTALVTAEAVPGLLLLVDLEAGRLFGVKGADAPELPSAFAQWNVLLDDLDQVQARLDLVDRVVGPGSRHRCHEVCQRAGELALGPPSGASRHLPQQVGEAKRWCLPAPPALRATSPRKWGRHVPSPAWGRESWLRARQASPLPRRWSSLSPRPRPGRRPVGRPAPGRGCRRRSSGPARGRERSTRGRRRAPRRCRSRGRAASPAPP